MKATTTTAHKGTTMGDVYAEAILAHQTWLARFQNALNGKDRDPLDPAPIRDDTLCNFGKWLHAHPEAFPSPQDYARVKAMHLAFHETAGDIALMIRQHYARDSIDIYMDEFLQQSKSLVAELLATRAAIEREPQG